MENILFNTNKNHSTNQIDVYTIERAFASIVAVLSIVYISLKVCAYFSMFTNYLQKFL